VSSPEGGLWLLVDADLGVPVIEGRIDVREVRALVRAAALFAP
jgi:hypothetical protein